MKSLSIICVTALTFAATSTSFAENKATTSEVPAALAALNPSASQVVTHQEASQVRGQGSFGTLLIGQGAIIDFYTQVKGFNIEGQVAGTSTAINSVNGDVTANSYGHAAFTVVDRVPVAKHDSGNGLITQIVGVYTGGKGAPVYVNGGAAGNSVSVDASHGNGFAVSTHGKAKQFSGAPTGFIRANTGTFSGEISILGSTKNVHINTYGGFSANLTGRLAH